MKQLLILISFFLTFQIFASVSVGENAKNFKLQGHDGKYYELSQFKGKTVVLEWFNQGCPFVKKHYNPGNMQGLQKEFKDDVVWLTISSSAPGKQGHLASSSIANKQYQDSKMFGKTILLDGKGEVGKMYQALTTPHMIIINPKGKIAYNGAIDSIPSTDSADIKGSVPLAKNAVQAIIAGKTAPRAQNKPYGCSVKY